MPKIHDHLGVPMTDDEALNLILAYARQLNLNELRAERNRLARIAEQAVTALANMDEEIAKLTETQSG